MTCSMRKKGREKQYQNQKFSNARNSQNTTQGKTLSRPGFIILSLLVGYPLPPHVSTRTVRRKSPPILTVSEEGVGFLCMPASLRPFPRLRYMSLDLRLALPSPMTYQTKLRVDYFRAGRPLP